MGDGIRLGNPAPLGLLAFGMTTAMLMYVDSGLVESEFEQFVACYAIFYGGLCQLLVAIFELFKGSSFSFAVFGSYGAFWLGWGMLIFKLEDENSNFVSTKEYADGKAAWLFSFGILSLCFFMVVLRKNICLIVTFGLLVITFFLLAGATISADATLKKVAGYFGLFTAISAFYTGIAELVNEEYGRMLLPGLTPLIVPSRIKITPETMASRTSYESRTNTLFLSFRSLQIRTLEDIEVIRSSVESAIINANAPEGKVHVIVDYNDVLIAEDIFQDYWEAVEALQEKYYLSASRFHVSSFGSGLRGPGQAEAGFKGALSGNFHRRPYARQHSKETHDVETGKSEA